MLEAIELCQQVAGKPLQWAYSDQNRTGDHIWWISDLTRFQSHYPEWQLRYSIVDILREMHEENRSRWVPAQ
jgi:CDP-paratose 2-epimerase